LYPTYNAADAFEYGDDDQEQLSSIFKKLDERQCMVLLSNSDTPFIRELYSDFMIYTKGESTQGHQLQGFKTWGS
jgi:site-specific DNA-adenine methylase